MTKKRLRITLGALALMLAIIGCGREFEAVKVRSERTSTPPQPQPQTQTQPPTQPQVPAESQAPDSQEAPIIEELTEPVPQVDISDENEPVITVEEGTRSSPRIVEPLVRTVEPLVRTPEGKTFLGFDVHKPVVQLIVRFVVNVDGVSYTLVKSKLLSEIPDQEYVVLTGPMGASKIENAAEVRLQYDSEEVIRLNSMFEVSVNCAEACRGLFVRLKKKNLEDGAETEVINAELNLKPDQDLLYDVASILPANVRVDVRALWQDLLRDAVRVQGAAVVDTLTTGLGSDRQ